MEVVTQNLQGESAPDDYAYLDLLRRAKVALDTAIDIVVPASDIRPFPEQPRKYFNPDGIKRLSDSIDSGGQVTPGLIRENPGETKYELIDGERRWRAVQQIPEDVRPDYKARLIKADDDVVRYLISGIANFNREGHTAVEMADTIAQLLSFKLPFVQIATLLGVSENWARQMHGLTKLVPQVQAMLDPSLPRAQQLPVVAAIHISKAEPRLQLRLAERVKSGEISTSRVRGEVVRTSQRAGAHIRLHEVSPLKRWESLGKKIHVIARTAGDAEDVIINGDLSRIIKGHPRDTQEQLREIKEAKSTLERLETLLKDAS